MSHYAFQFCGTTLHALPSGALYWPAQHSLCVSDLHFGKASRYAARGGSPLPPFETRDTLSRLDTDIAATQARRIICLGDSFDSLGASRDLDTDARLWITRLQAGREWIWIEGNHDPGPINLGGTHRAELPLAPLLFRHIAVPNAASGEISGHYHPKCSLRAGGKHISRACFVVDTHKLILPAYGTYTGGLDVRDPAYDPIVRKGAVCIMTGKTVHPVPRDSLGKPSSGTGI